MCADDATPYFLPQLQKPYKKGNKELIGKYPIIHSFPAPFYHKSYSTIQCRKKNSAATSEAVQKT